MAFCDVTCGGLKCLFKWIVNCVHKACAFLQLWNKWIVVSSSHLQKEHPGEFILLNSKNVLVRYKTLCKILYCNIRILQSVATILGKIHILSYSKTCPAKTFSKYDCEVGFRELARSCILYYSLLSNLLRQSIWCFLIEWWSWIERLIEFPE